MGVLKSISIAISTYSIIPMPRFSWAEDNLRYAIAALPVVGLFIGVLLLLWQALCAAMHLGSLLFAAVATLLPLAVSGGIHLDGYCDTVDALASHQPRERKLEILKDAHIGAFAVIYTVAYMLLCLGLYAELADSRALWVVAAGFVLSRALVALTAITLPSARREGMLGSFTAPAAKKAVCAVSAVIALLAVALMLDCHWQAAVGAVFAALITLAAYRVMALRNFGGITGDTSGFFLQVCELAILVGALFGDVAARQGLC